MMSFSGGWAAFVSCLLAVSAVATGNDAVVTDTSPACAHACQRSIYPLILACSNQDSNENIYDRGSFEVTSPECRGSDTSYLTTLAWCMSTQCTDSDANASSLQLFWGQLTTGDKSVQLKWDFPTALQIANTTAKPFDQLSSDAEILNSTALVNPAIYQQQHNLIQLTLSNDNHPSKTDLKPRAQLQIPNQPPTERTKPRYLTGTTNLYTLIILLASLTLPILLTLLSRTRTIPIPTLASSTGNLLDNYINPHLIYPSTYKSYQVQPLPNLLGTVPTRGQSLYILTLFILISTLSAINLQYTRPHTWYPTLNTYQTTTYVFQRTGIFAFTLLPLTILFSSRNNCLLWMTDWSHSTFLVLHRWIGRMCALLALVHALLALPLYFPAEARKAYWIWGAVAMVGLVVLVVGSGLYVRKFVYELFLVGHVLLTVLVIVGCWYHVHQWMKYGYGYVTWLLAACGVWLFDRIFRLGRLFGNGVRRARVREIGGRSEYVRVDVEGVKWGSAGPGMHVYAQFPSLNRWRPWENHPFSVMPTFLLLQGDGDGGGSSSWISESVDIELQENKVDFRLDVKKGVKVSQAVWSPREEAGRSGGQMTSGITMLIKKSSGLTKHFKNHDRLLTLLDGPYANNSATAILKCERLLLVAGGIGITAVLPWASHHSNVKLYWSVRNRAKCLVDELAGALSKVSEKYVKVGSRFNVKDLLAGEMDLGWSRVGVVVSGPGGLCDDVRSAVAVAGRKGGTVFELEVDVYSW